MILLSVWVITIGLIFIIPRDKKRLAIVAFLFKQFITWFTGLVVVEYKLLSYPIRLFAEVNRASFTYEYFVYPLICGIFNVFYPNDRSKLYKFGYYFAYCTVLTIPEIFIEKYTNLIVYLQWSWYWTWITLFITFMMSRGFCVWFFKGLSKEME
jgi:hypothetical protein